MAFKPRDARAVSFSSTFLAAPVRSCGITPRPPEIEVEPSSAFKTPVIILKSVDFPAPLSPIKAAVIPSPTLNETSSNKSRPVGSRYAMPLTSIAPIDS